MMWIFIIFLTNMTFAQEEFNPEWFKCKSFSNCEKVTGNLCDRAVAVNSKYINEYIDYSNKLNEENNCSPITKAQIQEDLKKLATCRQGKCELIIPSTGPKKAKKKTAKKSKVYENLELDLNKIREADPNVEIKIEVEE